MGSFYRGPSIFQFCRVWYCFLIRSLARIHKKEVTSSTTFLYRMELSIKEKSQGCPEPKTYMVVSLNRGPEYEPQEIIILIMGTPQKVPRNFQPEAGSRSTPPFAMSKLPELPRLTYPRCRCLFWVFRV